MRYHEQQEIRVTFHFALIYPLRRQRHVTKLKVQTLLVGLATSHMLTVVTAWNTYYA